MRPVLAIAALLVALAAPAAALAQAQCKIPERFEKPRAVFPPPGNAVIAPRTGHILALSWSPQFCKENGDEKKHASQCRVQKFGFILHGLWADGSGRNNPVWCKKVPAVPVEVMRRSYCAMPSPGLMQHEWAKHGSCIASDPASYFATGTRMFNALRFPDMTALSTQQIEIRDFVRAFAAANPGMPENAVSVILTPLGWLEEVRICYDLDFRVRACPDRLAGTPRGARIKIWR
jgi:ribonuclease T2